MLAGSHRDPRFLQGELIGITKDDNWFENSVDRFSLGWEPNPMRIGYHIKVLENQVNSMTESNPSYHVVGRLGQFRVYVSS